LLPESVWDASTDTLFLPPFLAEAYRTLIARHGLEKLSESRDPKNSPTGGHSQEETDRHFAQAFDGSAARAQLAVLDPKQEVSRAANTFIEILSGNRICITDAPCGAGATTFSFLAAVAELREREILPRHPLDVRLIGAEISVPARAYAEELLDELRPFLESQAIFVKAEILVVGCDQFFEQYRLDPPDDYRLLGLIKRLLVVANFSAFLEREKKERLQNPSSKNYSDFPRGAQAWPFGLNRIGKKLRMKMDCFPQFFAG